MRIRFRLFFFFLSVTWLTQTCLAEKLSGTIHSSDGTPLTNVEIFMGRDIPETRTATDGAFVIEVKWKDVVIFIAHPGFRPMVRSIDSFSKPVNIVLESESLSTWWLPVCSSELKAGKVFAPSINGPRLLLPKRAKFRKGSTDIDYHVDEIAFGWWNPQYLEFWIGPSAGGPRPPDYLFKQAKEFTLRFWRRKDSSDNGIDARGRDSKNRQWRHVNIGSTAILYRQASDAAAKFFDGIIDSMCIPAEADKIR
jgi:hypothetical protein